MMSWRAFMARAGAATSMGAVLFGLAMFAALRLAAADPGGPTRPELTFSGVLRLTSGAAFTGDTTLTFQFFKGGANVCSVTTRSISFTAAMGGAFAVPVPLAACRQDLFDGADVTYNVLQDLPAPAALLASNVAITPVPYARFADNAGGILDHACPTGYARDGAVSTSTLTICGRTVTLGSISYRDEVVKVGTGASAFWVDRFEASVYDRSGTLLGTGTSSSYPSLPRSGQWAPGVTQPPLLALSRGGVLPSANITWFQAMEVCRAAGKRLPNRAEWMAAAQGTVDSDSACWINPSNTATRPSNAMGACRSAWGAHDMIGNVWEWTDEWYSSVGQVTSAASGTDARVNGILVNESIDAWGAEFGNDGTANISSIVYNGAERQTGVPSAAVRGGSFFSGSRAGVFALSLSGGPASRGETTGFRCVVPD